MEREDKIAFGVVLGLFCGLGLGIMMLVKWIGVAVFGVFADASAGVGYQSAFLASLAISFLVIVAFALVSGDGSILGELPFVLIGFFVLIVFFTFSIAILF